MGNDRLAAALVGHKGREIAAKLARSKRGLFHVCGFCGVEWTTPLVSGPICGICEECAQFAAGFYLVAYREKLNIANDFDKIWRIAASDYARHEGHPAPAIPPGAPQSGDTRE